MKKLLIIMGIFFMLPNYSYASTATAHSYVIMDEITGRVIDSKNMNDSMLIASITKIMTAVLAIESNRLDAKVVVDETILKAYGSCLYIQVGEEMTLRDLLYGLMLRSGNDAAVMIAKFVANSPQNFVLKMNDKAKKIGMNNTMFYNPSGLDEEQGNYSSAYDMALLTRYANTLKDYREIVKTKKYVVKTNYKTYVWHNKNKLLQYNYITGGKTGYTKKAGRTLVSSAETDNMKFIVVTLRDSDDWNTHTSLYKMAFNNYQNYKVLNKDSFIVRGQKKYKGTLYIKKDVYIPLKKDEAEKLSSKVVLDDKQNYYNNDKIGVVNIYMDKILLYKENIYIKTSKKKTGWFK